MRSQPDIGLGLCCINKINWFLAGNIDDPCFFIIRDFGIESTVWGIKQSNFQTVFFIFFRQSMTLLQLSTILSAMSSIDQPSAFKSRMRECFTVWSWIIWVRVCVLRYSRSSAVKLIMLDFFSISAMPPSVDICIVLQNRNTIRLFKNHYTKKQFQQHFSTYLIHIQKNFLSIDTRFLTVASF